MNGRMVPPGDVWVWKENVLAFPQCWGPSPCTLPLCMVVVSSSQAGLQWPMGAVTPAPPAWEHPISCLSLFRRPPWPHHPVLTVSVLTLLSLTPVVNSVSHARSLSTYGILALWSGVSSTPRATGVR